MQICLLYSDSCFLWSGFHPHRFNWGPSQIPLHSVFSSRSHGEQPGQLTGWGREQRPPPFGDRIRGSTHPVSSLRSEDSLQKQAEFGGRNFFSMRLMNALNQESRFICVSTEPSSACYLKWGNDIIILTLSTKEVTAQGWSGKALKHPQDFAGSTWMSILPSGLSKGFSLHSLILGTEGNTRVAR